MKRHIKAVILALSVLLASFIPAGAQVAIKSNLLYDATLSPNIGIEVGVAPRWTVELSGNINAWTLSDGKRWKHWLAQPEARYWFC
ncbi:MAG: DUF3575 domain-containing protein, partial [Muribaculaceae bacterium]|nr:DUF3575 domain-containing protein [Muribaculaceae bacterium]